MKVRDPLAGFTDDMRDALEAGAKSMLVFSDAGDVRAVTHYDRTICKAVVMRVLLGLKLFEPIGEGECIRLTREGQQLARISTNRRASFAALRQREAANLREGRDFIQRMYARAEAARH
ncbi:MAG: hypothetical protein QM651_02220 [Rhodoblastus sp.]